MGWRTFNDRIGLILLVGLPVLWVLDGRGVVALQREVVGATLVTWALVTQYYFRRQPPPPGGDNGQPAG